MSAWLFPILTKLVVTVDRIENDHAVVEWENLAFGTLDLYVLPEHVQEGSKLEITLHPSPFGNLYAIHDDPGILQGAFSMVIPLSDIVIPGLYYYCSIRLKEEQ